MRDIQNHWYNTDDISTLPDLIWDSTPADAPSAPSYRRVDPNDFRSPSAQDAVPSDMRPFMTDLSAADDFDGETPGAPAANASFSALSAENNSPASGIPFDKMDPAEAPPYIFISYAHSNKLTVESYIHTMQEHDYNVWYDGNLRAGKHWIDELARHIVHCTQFVLFISNDSVNSEHVRKELDMALNYQRPICPVYLEPLRKKDFGLEYSLNSVQGILAYQYEQDESCQRLLASLNKLTLLRHRTKYAEHENDALSQLRQRFQFSEKLGHGGFSTLYLGRDLQTRQVVAIKHTAYSQREWNKYARQAMTRERMHLALLSNCPYIPTLIDFYSDEKNGYLVESYISGQTLFQHAAVSEKDCIRIAVQALRILIYLADRHIIHMDIKPSNMMLDEYGTLYLLDLGSSVTLNEVSFNTATPGYAAPEQYQLNSGSRVSFATDLYGLGRTLLHLLLKEKLEQQLLVSFSPHEDSLRYYRRDVSPMLERILCRMTLPDPHKRYQSAWDVINDLEAIPNTPLSERIRLKMQSDRNIRRYSKCVHEKTNVRLDTCDYTRPPKRTGPMPSQPVSTMPDRRSADSVVLSRTAPPAAPFPEGNEPFGTGPVHEMTGPMSPPAANGRSAMPSRSLADADDPEKIPAPMYRHGGAPIMPTTPADDDIDTLPNGPQPPWA